MTDDELRAKFEVLPCPFCGGIPVDNLKIHGRCIECQGCGASGPELPLGGDARDMERLWNHRTHASRDAEVEALKKDAERYRWLVENCSSNGGLGVEIFIGDDAPDAIDLAAAIDAAMREEE